MVFAIQSSNLLQPATNRVHSRDANLLINKINAGADNQSHPVILRWADNLTLPHRLGPYPAHLPADNIHGIITQEGRPVYVERLGLLNVSALYAITTKERQLKRLVYEYEKFLSERLPACAKAVGHPVETCCSILDLNGASLLDFWRVKDYINEASEIYQNHYPECMGKLFIINAPWGFASIFNLIKGWLDPVTVAKIAVLGGNYQGALLAQIPAENLPKEFGGLCECKEGCSLSDAGPWKET